MATQTTSRREFHPAVFISSWLIFAIAVECASTERLQWFVAVALLLLPNGGAWNRFTGLAWKARWLWLAMMALHSWTIPGILVWPVEWSPTYAGLEAGAIRIERLLLLLAALSTLMSTLTATQIAAGLYLLARPFAWVGLDRRALAVRLALTMALVQNTTRPSSWLEALQSPHLPQGEPGEMQLRVPSVGAWDIAVLLSAVALLGMAVG